MDRRDGGTYCRNTVPSIDSPDSVEHEILQRVENAGISTFPSALVSLWGKAGVIFALPMFTTSRTTMNGTSRSEPSEDSALFW